MEDNAVALEALYAKEAKLIKELKAVRETIVIMGGVAEPEHPVVVITESHYRPSYYTPLTVLPTDPKWKPKEVVRKKIVRALGLVQEIDANDIYRIILHNEPKGTRVNEHHLKTTCGELKLANVIGGEKRGMRNIYWLNPTK